MRRRRTDRQETFDPLRDKTLFAVLLQLFTTEFGYSDKVMFAEAMIERILHTVNTYTVSQNDAHPGQFVWMAVAYDGHKHAMKPMREIPQVPVVLDLVTDDELQKLSSGVPFPEVRRNRHARLLEQALAQGGVLAQSDLSAISLCHHRVIYDDIKAIRMEKGAPPPYRGLLQDVGATTTHKVQVARLLEQGHLEPEICRLLKPTHSLDSVENYAQAYKNTIKLLDGGFAPDQISGILGLGKRVVEQYST